MTPIRVFVSHASEDEDVLAAIHSAVRRSLPNARVLNVDRHLLPGKAIDAGLTGLIETSRVFVHVSSLASRQSGWVAQEVEFARAREQLGQIYFVTLLADADVSTDGELDGSRKYLRYDRDQERALGELVEAIARVAPSALISPVDSRVISYRRTASALFLALVTTMLLVGANIGINSPTAVGWLHLLQALIIAYLAVDIHIVRQKTTRDPRSTRVLSMWLWVWISWMTLYVLRFVDFQYPEVTLLGVSYPRFFNHLAGIPSVLGTVFVYFTYLRLDVREEEHYDDAGWNQYAFPVATTALLSGFYLLLAFGIVRSSFWPDLIKSIWLGLAISLVGGRLSSRLINAPRLPVTFFYMYGLLQMLFPIFQTSSAALPEIVPFTHYGYRLALLAGKTLLADVLAWAVLTRRLEFFLMRMEPLTANVDEEFRRWSDPDVSPPLTGRAMGRGERTVGV
jgi:hypothetical protein